MRKQLSVLLLAVAAVLPSAAQKVKSNGYPFAQVPFTAVKVQPTSFWGQRIGAARDVTIPLAFSKCQSEGRYENFVRAAHPSDAYDVGTFMGFSFDDTDVYKTIEGASYELQTFPDKRLKLYIDSVLDVVAAAQEADGYLYTARTINPKKPHPWSGDRRWVKEEVLSHELYNLGHMVDAACAHHLATGSDKFLNIARRYADCVLREVGPAAGQACVVPGHQIAEMALARLYLLTGEKKYLDEAKFFLDYRGKTEIHDIYTQSLQPVTEQTEAWGHAVRAGYMYAGMADVAALTGDSAYIRAIDRICENIVARKYYITGGVGARHEGEAFGADYELPNLTAYNETCAAISMVYLFHRMFMLHGDAKYVDCLERTLYNGVISGMSVDGGRFFYPNPLSSDGLYAFNADNTKTRQPWFGCACCPSNLSRFIPSLPGYVYAVRETGGTASPRLYVNLFAANTATVRLNGKDVELEQVTDYPWTGDVAINIRKNKAGRFALMVRIPGWARGEVVPSDLYTFVQSATPPFTVSVNGQPADATLHDGYVEIDRVWKRGDRVTVTLPMEVKTIEANPRVQADRGKWAVQRGPLVYCAEWADNDGTNVHHALLPAAPTFEVDNAYTIDNTEAVTAAQSSSRFAVTALHTQAHEALLAPDGSLTSRPVRLTLIPYYAWNHRGAGVMDVWLAHSLSGLDD